MIGHGQLPGVAKRCPGFDLRRWLVGGMGCAARPAAAGVTNALPQALVAVTHAVEKGLHENVRHLLQAGARIDASDYSGRTARDWAEDSRNRSTIALLSAAR